MGAHPGQLEGVVAFDHGAHHAHTPGRVAFDHGAHHAHTPGVVAFDHGAHPDKLEEVDRDTPGVVASDHGVPSDVLEGVDRDTPGVVAVDHGARHAHIPGVLALDHGAHPGELEGVGRDTPGVVALDHRVRHVYTRGVFDDVGAHRDVLEGVVPDIPEAVGHDMQGYHDAQVGAGVMHGEMVWAGAGPQLHVPGKVGAVLVKSARCPETCVMNAEAGDQLFLVPHDAYVCVGDQHPHHMAWDGVLHADGAALRGEDNAPSASVHAEVGAVDCAHLDAPVSKQVAVHGQHEEQSGSNRVERAAISVTPRIFVGGLVGGGSDGLIK